MTSEPDVPPGVDPAQPSAARIYDALLGGTSNYEADRAAAERVKAHAPEMVDSAWANRGFHQRAARWIAQQGVRQFIDLGSGLPTVGNTHEVVRQVIPGARVVYVDNDPMVLAYGRQLLGPDQGAAVILADAREPDQVLSDPVLRSLIDFTQPTGLLITAVLHFVSDDSDPQAMISAYMQALAPGSYLALSHATGDQKPPQAVQGLAEAYGGGYARSKDQVRKLLNDMEIVPPYRGADPDLTWVGLWGAEDLELADSEGSRWLYCAVAKRPA
jgi:hypothetical protein